MRKAITLLLPFLLLLSLAVLPYGGVALAHAAAGIAFVQQMDAKASCSMTCTITFSQASRPGDFLIVSSVETGFNPSDIPVITDNSGNQYVPVGIFAQATSFHMVIWTARNAAPTTTATLTSQGTGGTYRFFWAEYSGVVASGNYFSNPQTYTTILPSTTNPSATVGMGAQPHVRYASWDWMLGIFGTNATDPGQETIQTGTARLTTHICCTDIFFGDNQGDTVSFTSPSPTNAAQFGMELEGSNPSPVGSSIPILNNQANAISCKFPSPSPCSNAFTISAAGDTLVYFFRAPTGWSINTPTDTFGDTWVSAGVVNSADPNCDTSYVYTATSKNFGADTVTITISGSSSFLGELLDFKGLVQVGKITSMYGFGMTSTSCSNGGSDVISDSENLFGGVTSTANSWDLVFTGYSGSFGTCGAAFSPGAPGVTFFAGMSASAPMTDCSWAQEMVGGYIVSSGGAANSMFWRDIHWNTGWERYFDVSVELISNFIPNTQGPPPQSLDLPISAFPILLFVIFGGAGAAVLILAISSRDE